MLVTEAVREEKPSYSTNPPNYDGLWKKLISELFEEFMQFFAPDLYNEIDFTRNPDFLQQELHNLIITERKGTNYTDQIVKVPLKNGEDKWVLIHIEVGGKSSEILPNRMFRYFYRIYDKFDHEIYAIALVTSNTASSYPNHFHYSFHGTKIEYTYNVYKFSDHTEEKLKQSSNPFAAAIIAAKKANTSKTDAKARLSFKRELMKQTLRRFSDKDEQSNRYLHALFYFIDYLLKIPGYLQETLRSDLTKFVGKEDVHQMKTNEMEMSPTLAGIFEDLEKMAIEKGLEKGMEQGMEKGIEKGIEKGSQETKLSIARNLLREEFSDEKIVELTGLEKDKIDSLRESPDN